MFSNGEITLLTMECNLLGFTCLPQPVLIIE
jgi:hypothetical protein